MNIQGEAGINWTDATWNPVTGCLHGCPYCYAAALSHRLGRSFDPAFHPERLTDPIKQRKPLRIFTCSMADLFGRWVPVQWIAATMGTVKQCPHHTFQFLTKNPNRLSMVNPWPSNTWAGGTVDVRARLAPTIAALRTVDAPVRFISFEPLNANMGTPDLSGIQWVIIGAQTGKGAHQPPPEWVVSLMKAADVAGAAVLMKDNLVWDHRREEFPIHQPTSDQGPSPMPAQLPLLA